MKQMIRLFQSKYLMILTLLAALAVAIIPIRVYAQNPVNPRLNADRVAQMADKARDEGRVRVIVRFEVPNMEKLKQDSARVQAVRPGFEEPDKAAMADRPMVDAIGDAARGVTSRLNAGDHHVYHSYDYMPFMALEVTEAGLATLAASSDILSIEEDVPVPLADTTVEKAPLSAPFEDSAVPPSLNNTVSIIGADTVWGQGYTGAGWYVAILDTGIRETHEMFAGKTVVESCFSADSHCPNNGTVDTSDGSAVHHSNTYNGWDHGTHVAGIATGNNGTLFGVAKDANIVAVQVFSKFDDCDPDTAGNQPCVQSWNSDQLAGLNHVYGLRSTYSIASANMSLGGGTNTSYCDGASQKAGVDLLKSVGIATVIATGNNGYCGSIGSPACISTAVAVGASTDGDAEASFNNWHPTLQELFAPGVGINSATGDGDSTYESWNGTSMATPHVAGAWALLKDKNHFASVDEIYSALRATGHSIVTGCSDAGSLPRIQVDQAAAAITASVTLTAAIGTGTGTVASSPSGINCPGDCSEEYVNGTTVTLTATPGASQALLDWTGAACNGNGPCEILLSNSVTVTANFGADGDSDGIGTSIEDAGPNGGDGDSSGTLDSLEDHVATFPNANNDYVTIVGPGGSTLANVASNGNPSSGDSPSRTNFPDGFYDFQLSGFVGPTTVEILLPKDTSINTYYKYGPEPGDASNHWYEFKYDGTTGVEIFQEATRTRIVLHFVDGQRGDDDLVVDGDIEDIGAPGVYTAPSASTSGASGGGGGGGGGGCYIETVQ